MSAASRDFEYGDFQTPLPLARAVLEVVGAGSWGRILEPCCGIGNFLTAAREMSDAELIGVEVQQEHSDVARATGAAILNEDVFTTDLIALPWRDASASLLVVGNPPWVTNSALGRAVSTNRPERSNFKRLSGMDALTGASNFDIAEYIWLKLLTDLAPQEPTVALLSKTQVARNVLAFCAAQSLPVRSSSIHVIDAQKWFGANVDACLFVLSMTSGGHCYETDVFASLDATGPTSRVGVVGGRIVADLHAYEMSRSLEGDCPVQWRQGVKHDAAGVMELTATPDGPRRRDGSPVAVEPDYLYPLVKSTDVFHGRIEELSRWVVVPQRSLGEDTTALARLAPELWAYLVANGDALDARKSSIYRRKPRFSIFGIGSYTFADYKVAVSGLHKTPVFRLLGPIAGKPVVLDDTCYFLACADLLEGALLHAMLTAPVAAAFFEGVVFTDAKRPITKKLLQRLDLSEVVSQTPRSTLVETAMQSSSRAGVVASRTAVEQRLDELAGQWAARDRPILLDV